MALRALARVLIAVLFLLSGINHIQNFHRDAGWIKQQLIHLGVKVPAQAPTVLMAAAIFFLLSGALLLGTGLSEKLGALCLLSFLIPTTVIMHAFWAEKTEEKKLEALGMFLKNLSLVGGLLFVLSVQHASGRTTAGKTKSH